VSFLSGGSHVVRTSLIGAEVGAMELRIMPSDPGFRDVEFIADWIAKLKNAHLFHDLKDMPEIERLVHLKDLEELFEQLMH
jgi:hypothetical protein